MPGRRVPTRPRGAVLRAASARSLGIAAIASAAALVWAEKAEARAGGIVTDSCAGCHGSNEAPPDLTLTADRATFNPGESVTFTLTIRSPTIRVGGTFISTAGVGTFQALPGEGLAVNMQGLTHTAPKAAVSGAVTFRFGWQAPAKPGGVDFRVAALAGNGNNATSGDSPGSGEFQWVFGCSARIFYLDLDRDGYGSHISGTRLGCTGDPPPDGYATMDGDCDENDENVHPGATEICNLKDDDCNGQIDENAPPVMMWPDGDGDGYYKSQTGTSKLGCGNLAGYATKGGDCDDADPAVHPGATEICNNKDDNCNGETDERVRPQCGVGWCARYSPTCNPADCRPGPPTKEICNSFDDDCDGENDNGACPAGMLCMGDQCVANGGGAMSTAGASGSASGESAAGPGGSASATGSSVASTTGSLPTADAAAPSAGMSGGGAVAPSGSGCTVAPMSRRSAGETSAGESWLALALAAGLRGASFRTAKRRSSRHPPP